MEENRRRFRGRLILFDLDDTLFDFASTWHVALVRTFSVYGPTLGLNPEEVTRSFLDVNDRLYSEHERGVLTLEEFRERRLREALEPYGLPIDREDAREHQRLYLEFYWETLQPEPALIELLQRLARKYRLGIVTNGPHDTQREKLVRLGLTDLFPESAVLISHEVGFAKPDPRIYRLALERFGVRAQDALFVGDSWEADVAGAMDAGLQAVWLNKKRRQPATAHEPLGVIAHWSELPSVCDLE